MIKKFSVGRTLCLINVFMCFMYTVLTIFYVMSLSSNSAQIEIDNKKSQTSSTVLCLRDNTTKSKSDELPLSLGPGE